MDIQFLAKFKDLISATHKRATDRFKKNNQTIVASAKKTEASVGGSFSKLGGVIKLIVASVIIRSIIRIGVHLKDLRADAEEVDNKLTEIFQSQAESVKAWAKTYGTSFGIARTEVKEFVSQAGDYLQPLGYFGDALANSSKELVKLSADVSSFKNVSIDRSFRALASAITGEYEPLKGVGVILRDVDVKARITAEGFDTSTASALKLARAKATLLLVQENLLSSSGDLEDTIESLQNRSRTLAGAWTDLKTNIADVLPIEEAVWILKELVQWTNRAIEIRKEAKKGEKDFRDELAKVNDEFRRLQGTANQYDEQIKKHRSSIKQLEDQIIELTEAQEENRRKTEESIAKGQKNYVLAFLQQEKKIEEEINQLLEDRKNVNTFGEKEKINNKLDILKAEHKEIQMLKQNGILQAGISKEVVDRATSYHNASDTGKLALDNAERLKGVYEKGSKVLEKQAEAHKTILDSIKYQKEQVGLVEAEKTNELNKLSRQSQGLKNVVEGYNPLITAEDKRHEQLDLTNEKIEKQIGLINRLNEATQKGQDVSIPYRLNDSDTDRFRTIGGSATP